MSDPAPYDPSADYIAPAPEHPTGFVLAPPALPAAEPLAADEACSRRNLFRSLGAAAAERALAKIDDVKARVQELGD